MEHLYIDKSPHTPEVYFNIDDSKLCIIGRSFPEDAAQFYMPIMSWLENNIQEFENGFAIDVQLEYYNTSSSKYLLKMFYFLEKYHLYNLPMDEALAYNKRLLCNLHIFSLMKLYIKVIMLLAL